MRWPLAVFLVGIASLPAFPQNYTISTFAGGALPVNIAGTSASLYGPQAVVTDQKGNIHQVHALSPNNGLYRRYRQKS